MNIPDEIVAQIQASAKDVWPDDKDMQAYSVKTELDAYRKFSEIDFQGVSDREKSALILEARETHDSWEEIVEFINDELDAMKELQEFSSDEIDPNLLEQWKSEAAKDNEGYYRGQMDFLESRLAKHLSILSTRDAIDPIKKVLIEMENIVGNECYNGNIQNYGSWGELESVGRSFRYPVKFYGADTEYKRRSVDASIPSEELITGYYAFGANELGVYRALHKILKHLEENYGLRLPKN